MDKPQVAVIGAGLMGHGIAYLFAAGGHQVRVQDPLPEALDKLPERIGDICDLLGADRSAVDRVSGGQSLAWAVASGGRLLHTVNQQHMIALGENQKLLPGSIIRQRSVRRQPGNGVSRSSTVRRSKVPSALRTKT